ncbi:MAG TPA: hypothetical protein VK817_16185 [Trebonia sp.]|jgi:pimeloyl-ACP methyl ester carboxylesterase|nr:hypothetical protein [Trebonia sp.]
MPSIELSTGRIEYQDIGGGPVLVLLHGLLMDSSLWDAVTADLAADHRCVVPTLPLWLKDFKRPALIAWAAGDRVMPPEHGKRLAALLPNATLVEIADSYTLIPLDQPTALTRALRGFVHHP